MKGKLMGFFLALTLLLALVACGNTQENQQAAIAPANEPEAVSTQVEDTEKKETYPEIKEFFLEVIPDAEIKVTLRNGSTIHTKIKTQLSSGAAPDGWPEIIAAFETALVSAEEKKSDYKASAASAEILAADEIILASGFNSAVQFNKFDEKSIGGDTNVNPPTISKFEHDQIGVGMTLSEVRKIVGGDGTLETSVGTPGVISVVQTYRFPGEREGSYADILFDDYVVYSKFEFMLD